LGISKECTGFGAAPKGSKRVAATAEALLVPITFTKKHTEDRTKKRQKVYLGISGISRLDTSGVPDKQEGAH